MPINSQNLRHLRAFLAVAEKNSINSATHTVFLSQPAITHAIAKLEKELGCILFIRKSNGMYLTDSGKAYQIRAQRALLIIQEGIFSALGLNTVGAVKKSKQLLSVITATQLKALVAVTKNKSYADAALAIDISQSSIRRSSRDLENLLGTPLYERTSTGITPSKAAGALTMATNLAFYELAQAKEEVYRLQNIEIGQLKIGGILPLSSPVLPNSILSFSETHPAFKFSLSNLYSLFDLRSANLDLLIGPLHHPAYDDLIQQPLLSSKIVIIARIDHPLCRERHASLEQLAKYSWVIPEQGTPSRDIYNALFDNNIEQTNSAAIEVSSVVVMRQILEHSDKLAIVSSLMVQRELSDQALTIIPCKLLKSEQTIGITYRKNWLPTATQQRFISLLQATAKSTPGSA